MIQSTNERSCGKCSLCCKFFDIPELNKSEGEWCRHCQPGKGGCTIHDRRPNVCRKFDCIWKESLDILRDEEILGDDWFPQHCKMVLYLLADDGDDGDDGDDKRLIVKVDPSFPDAWRQEPYYSKLLEISFDMRVFVQVLGQKGVQGDNKQWVLQYGIEQKAVYVPETDRFEYDVLKIDYDSFGRGL